MDQLDGRLVLFPAVARLDANGQDQPFALGGLIPSDNGQEFAADCLVFDLALERRLDNENNVVILVGRLLDGDLNLLLIDEFESSFLIDRQRLARHALELEAM